MSQVKVIWSVPEAEKLIAYIARVSSPHQDNPSYENLIKYLLKHNHFSPFEMISMCVEINTTRAISAQILRHRSFSFQEFSARYSEVQGCSIAEARRQDEKNRQNSVDDLPNDVKDWFEDAQSKVINLSTSLYDEALKKGIAKESCRFLLPMSSETKLYMTGNIRSFMHYIQVRDEDGVQAEHRIIAQEIKKIMINLYPTLSKALGWV